MNTVSVVDYGMSNLRSVIKALERVAGNGWRIELADTPEQLRRAERVVFPGQGAIGRCMENLEQAGLREALEEALASRPYLGICLGQQCLMARSEESDGTPGLGVIPGSVVRFPAGRRDAAGRLYKIPHMGWNQVTPVYDHPLWRDIAPGEPFYFVHSYHAAPDRDEDIAARTEYVVDFASVIARDNVFAVQFHPEKSQNAGLQLLKNFLAWRP